MPTLKQFCSFMSALLVGEGVSVERRRKRVTICYTCRHARLDGCSKPRCSICNCQIEWLARYKETKRYGCKHKKGSRWKEAGV